MGFSFYFMHNIHGTHIGPFHNTREVEHSNGRIEIAHKRVTLPIKMEESKNGE
jgi:hypothetical protein